MKRRIPNSNEESSSSLSSIEEEIAIKEGTGLTSLIITILFIALYYLRRYLMANRLPLILIINGLLSGYIISLYFDYLSCQKEKIYLAYQLRFARAYIRNFTGTVKNNLQGLEVIPYL